MKNKKLMYGYGFRMLPCYSKSVNYILETRNKKPLIKTRTNRSEKRSEGLKVVNLRKKVTRHVFNSTVLVYNGRKFIPITITALKIGLAYKQLVLTKRQGSEIHKKKRKQKNE